MIRLIFILLLFLISLLSIFKAPAYYLWLLAIVVTEYPAIFIAFMAIALATGIWVSKYQLASGILGGLALVLFLSPIVQSYLVASTLPQNFTAAFGSNNTGSNTENPPPFSFFRQFAGKKKVTYQTFVYTQPPDTALSMDFYPASVSGDRPCVIMIHGGAWNSGDSKQLPELNSYLAEKGYNVAAINYRMAPKYKNPAPVEDIHHAVTYLRAHAGKLHIDTNNFVLLGRSAGAQIALLSAYEKHEPGLKGVIDFYGPADMVWGYSIPSNPLVMDSRKVMRDYIGGSYQEVPQKYKASSPIEFVGRQSVPTLIIHGDNDVLVSPEHSRRLNEKLQQNGIRHFLLKLPWATHGFDFNLNGPGGQLSTYVVLRFLKTVTR